MENNNNEEKLAKTIQKLIKFDHEAEVYNSCDAEQQCKLLNHADLIEEESRKFLEKVHLKRLDLTKDDEQVSMMLRNLPDYFYTYLRTVLYELALGKGYIDLDGNMEIKQEITHEVLEQKDGFYEFLDEEIERFVETQANKQARTVKLKEEMLDEFSDTIARANIIYNKMEQFTLKEIHKIWDKNIGLEIPKKSDRRSNGFQFRSM